MATSSHPLSAGTRTRANYEAGVGEQGLLARLVPWLERLPPGEAGERQLAALDHFHVGGPAASAELAALALVEPGARILDAGSGLGGPSRFLASVHGCSVLGVDLSPAFVEVARHLAERSGLSGKVRYEIGDIGDLPCEDEAFDLVWTEHVLINLADRHRVYGELHRVLRPGGRLAFYEPVAIEGRDLLFPVPWAADDETSYLLTENETVSALQRSGFKVIEWRDTSAAAMATFTQQQSIPPGAGGLGLVMGPRFAEMAANFARSIGEGRIQLVMGVASRS
jgi:SAM-dependent methyltransferase